jgi:hypothetical protein
MSTLFYESHCTTDLYSLSLSSFYTLHHVLQSHHQVNHLTCFHFFSIHKKRFMYDVISAELAFSQLADIPSFIPHHNNNNHAC